MQRPKKQVKPPRRKLMGGERAHEEASRRVTKTSRWVPQPGSRCLCFTHTHRLTLRSHTVSFSIWSGRWGRARQGRNKCTLTLFAQKSPCMPKTEKPREVKDPCQAAWCPWLCPCSLGQGQEMPCHGQSYGLWTVLLVKVVSCLRPKQPTNECELTRKEKAQKSHRCKVAWRPAP